MNNIRMNNMFTKNDWDYLHDVIYGYCKKSLDMNSLERFYTKIPENLKEDAFKYGMSDTVFRDNLYDWLNSDNSEIRLLFDDIEKISLIGIGNDMEEGDTIEFEMPSFCSGDYSAKIYKDSKFGLFIFKEDDYLSVCRDFKIIKNT
jgi:hypothetical protein